MVRIKDLKRGACALELTVRTKGKQLQLLMLSHGVLTAIDIERASLAIHIPVFSFPSYLPLLCSLRGPLMFSAQAY